MAETIDSLQIRINANASSAANGLKKLTEYLTTLSTAVSGMNMSGLSTLSSQLLAFTSATTTFKNSGINQADFTRIAKGINSLNTIDTTKLSSTATGLTQFATAVQQLSATASASNGVREILTSINALGGANTQRAIQNLPALTTGLQNLLTTLSRVPSINSSVVQMTTALANLSANGARVGTAGRSIMGGFNNIGTTARTARTHVFSLAAAFGKFYASYFLVMRAVKGLWKSITSSMSYVETYNYFNVALTKVTKDFNEKYKESGKENAESYGEGFREQLKSVTQKMTGYELQESGALTLTDTKSLGLDPNLVMNYQAKILGVTNSVGLLGDVSVDTAEALSMLASDYSSLTNTDLNTVMQNFQSGLVGQSRALYKFGLDITSASLAETALANGITKSVSAMSQSEKMQLRVLTILQNSQVAWGDNARTINSAANSYRVFQQQLSNLGRNFANLFLNTVKATLPVLNGMVMAMNDLFQSIGFSLFGETWLDDLMGQITGSKDATDDMNDSLGDTDEDLQNAEQSAKKLKKQLQSFDELNVLSRDENKNALAKFAGDINLSAQIKDELDKYRKKWQEAFDGVENNALKFRDKFKDILAPVKLIVEDFSIGDFFKAGQDTGEMVTSIFDFFTKAIENVDWKQIGHNIGEFFNGINWKEVLRSVGNFFGTILENGFELLKGVWDASPLLAVISTGLLLARPLGLTSALSSVIAAAMPTTLPLGATLTLTGITFVAGFNVGKEIGKALFPRDREYYENFKWFGSDDSFWQEIMTATWEELKNALNEFFKKNTLGSLLFGATSVGDGGLISESNKEKTSWLSRLFTGSSGISGLGLSSLTDGSYKDTVDDFNKENGIVDYTVVNSFNMNESKFDDVSNSIEETSTRQEKLLQEQNELLGQIATKDFTINSSDLFHSVQTSAFNFNTRTGLPAFP